MHPLVKWEYLTESISVTERWNPKKQAESLQNFSDRLNGLGAQGWEMISYQNIPLMGNLTGNVKGQLYLAIFKRQLS